MPTFNCFYLIRGAYDKFPDIFRMCTFIDSNTWNSSPLRSHLPWLQCTYCTVQTTSGRPHRIPLELACQWPSSQPLSSPQVLDYREAEELSWCPSWSNSLWQRWSCGLLYCPGGNATDPIWRVLASSDEISS